MWKPQAAHMKHIRRYRYVKKKIEKQYHLFSLTALPLYTRTLPDCATSGCETGSAPLSCSVAPMKHNSVAPTPPPTPSPPSQSTPSATHNSRHKEWPKRPKLQNISEGTATCSTYDGAVRHAKVEPMASKAVRASPPQGLLELTHGHALPLHSRVQLGSIRV